MSNGIIMLTFSHLRHTNYIFSNFKHSKFGFNSFFLSHSGKHHMNWQFCEVKKEKKMLYRWWKIRNISDIIIFVQFSIGVQHELSLESSSRIFRISTDGKKLLLTSNEKPIFAQFKLSLKLMINSSYIMDC